MDKTTATQPTADEVALRNRIKALQALAGTLHNELTTYAEKQTPDTAATLKDAIDAHVVATGAFCDSALACVPPTGR